MNIAEKIKRRFIRRQIGKLSKTAVMLNSDKFIRFMEPGRKTYGRVHMFKSADLIFKYVYGFDYEVKFGLQSVGFGEDESFIYVKLLMFRPGVFIGKMGSLCDETEQLFKEAFGKPVKINIEEAKKRMRGFDFVDIS